MEFILEMQCDDPWINPFEYLDDAQKEKMLMHCYGVTQEQAIEHIKAKRKQETHSFVEINLSPNPQVSDSPNWNFTYMKMNFPSLSTILN
ncbi:MAG: hypothetical protein V8R14_05375 [Clostridia bacterium]